MPAQLEDGDDVIGVLDRLRSSRSGGWPSTRSAAAPKTAPSRQWPGRSRRTSAATTGRPPRDRAWRRGPADLDGLRSARRARALAARSHCAARLQCVTGRSARWGGSVRNGERSASVFTARAGASRLVDVALADGIDPRIGKNTVSTARRGHSHAQARRAPPPLAVEVAEERRAAHAATARAGGVQRGAAGGVDAEVAVPRRDARHRWSRSHRRARASASREASLEHGPRCTAEYDLAPVLRNIRGGGRAASLPSMSRRNTGARTVEVSCTGAIADGAGPGECSGSGQGLGRLA